MPHSYKHILVQCSDGIATVTINRPEALNALSVAVIEDLRFFVESAAEDDSIQAIILTGAGEKAFVAGADIAELNKLDRESGEEYSLNGNKAFRALEQIKKPVIAAVNGFALGGGCELAMACHMRFASTKAKFGQPEVNLGLIPGFGGTQRLMRLVGASRAMELILTGNMIDANEAYRIGLVNKVVEPDQLIATCTDLLKLILSKGPIAVQNSLRAITAGLDTSLDIGLTREAYWFGASCGSEDMKEGTGAFLEKRKPVWKNR